MKGILPTDICGEGEETQDSHSAQAFLFLLSAARKTSVSDSMKQAFIDFAIERQIDREKIFVFGEGKMQEGPRSKTEEPRKKGSFTPQEESLSRSQSPAQQGESGVFGQGLLRPSLVGCSLNSLAPLPGPCVSMHKKAHIERHASKTLAASLQKAENRNEGMELGNLPCRMEKSDPTWADN